MKDAAVFVMSMVVSAIVFTAGHLATATDTKLFTTGRVMIDMCSVSGELIRKEDGVYAHFVVGTESDSDATVSFHYAAYCTPASSQLSRMMPRPVEVKADQCKVELSAGERRTVEVLVRHEQMTDKQDEIEPVSVIAKAGSDRWTLAVSRTAIEKLAGFGAVLPLSVRGNVSLQAGTAVLDSGSTVNGDAR